MRQASIKLKMYANNIDVIGDNMQKFSLHAILWSFGILGAWYVLLLGNMVFNIVERRALDVEARVLSSEVGELELTYLSMSKSIDLNLSYSIGFQEVKTKYATRKSLGSLDSVKMSQNEI